MPMPQCVCLTRMEPFKFRIQVSSRRFRLLYRVVTLGVIKVQKPSEGLSAGVASLAVWVAAVSLK